MNDLYTGQEARMDARGGALDLPPLLLSYRCEVHLFSLKEADRESKREKKQI